MQRLEFINKIGELFRVFPVVALVGPRQVGKTTLAREWYKTQMAKSNSLAESGSGGLYLDLQDPGDLAQLEAPSLTITTDRSFVVIDEIQLRPDLFSFLRSFIDRTERKIPIMVLGSASRDLINQSSESLAGRIAFLELTPFTLGETGFSPRRHFRGGYPLSYLASSDDDSNQWRQEYIRSFLERDIPQLGFNIPAMAMRRVWEMLAHVHGNILNLSELGRSLGVSDHTIRRYIDILQGTFIIRTLAPWYENVSKRQVKAPKVYIRDSGLLHSLLRITTPDQLPGHPKYGASWEGLAIEALISKYGWRPEDIFFWATHSGAELDLFVIHQGERLGFEFKVSDSPKVTQSMKRAAETLSLDRLTIIIPGHRSRFKLAEKIEVVSFGELFRIIHEKPL